MSRQRERRTSRERQSNWKTTRTRERSPSPTGKPSSRHRSSRQSTLSASDHHRDSTKPEKQFSNRCKLFVGNLPTGTTEKELLELFSPYGKTDDAFIAAGRNFGFLKLDTRQHTELAKLHLDNTVYKGRTIRVRFAASNATVTVHNLNHCVSNEYLEDAFSMFGEVERAVIMTDERSRSMGHGYVEFVRRGSAQNAVRRCKEGSFLLTRSPIPVIVQPMSAEQDEDGVSERSIKNLPDYPKERDGVRPRFALPRSFEGEIAGRFKALAELEQQQKEVLEKQMKEGKEKLEKEVEALLHERRATLMRQELLKREEDIRRFDTLRQYEENMMAEIEREDEDLTYGHHQGFSDLPSRAFEGDYFTSDDAGGTIATERLLMQTHTAGYKRDIMSEEIPASLFASRFPDEAPQHIRPLMDDHPVDERFVLDERRALEEQQTFDEQQAFEEHPLDDQGALDEQHVLDEQHILDERQALEERRAFEERRALDKRRSLGGRRALDERLARNERQAISERHAFERGLNDRRMRPGSFARPRPDLRDEIPRRRTYTGYLGEIHPSSLTFGESSSKKRRY